MGKLILSLLLVISLSCATLSAPYTPDQAIASVRRLVINGQSWCTAFSIDSGVWVTAAHCVEDGGNFMLEGGGGRVYRRFLEDDIAILLGPSAPPLTLSSVAPKVGDHVYTLGHTRPIPLLIFFGRVSRVNTTAGGNIWKSNLIIQDGGGPGVSGAPILNERGEVISVMQGGYRVLYTTNMSLGLPFSRLWDLLGPYTMTPGTDRTGFDWLPDWLPFADSGDDSPAGDADVEGLSSHSR